LLNSQSFNNWSMQNNFQFWLIKQSYLILSYLILLHMVDHP
jgi:hypothetical protein